MYGTCNPYLPVRPVLAPGGEMPRSEDIRLTRDFFFFFVWQRCVLRISYHFTARDSSRDVTRLTCIRRRPQRPFQRSRRVGRQM